MAKQPTADPARRCLIRVTAFAEAQGPRGGKTRSWFTPPEQPLFAWAGLWRPSAEWGEVYAGVMAEANACVAPVHDRMPVILSPDDYAAWLHGELDDLLALQRPYPCDAMVVTPTDEPWADGTRQPTLF